MSATSPVLQDHEADLVERCRAREDEAWQELRAAYETRVLRLAYGFFRDPMLAEDIAQETFLRAFGALDGFRGGGKLAGWLRRIALNLCLRHRERQRQGDVSLDEPEGQYLVDDPARAAESAEDAYLRGETARSIQKAIGQLPGNYRVAVALADLQGRDYGEIAEMTDVPLGTVKSRISRGRARVRRMVTGSI